MFASSFDVGPNLYAISVAMITLLTLIWNTRKTAQAAKASEKAAAQLENNGGSSMLDKIDRIEASQHVILHELKAHGERIDALETRKSDLPPPPLPQWLRHRTGS